jgi:diadenylate cyclase
MILLREIWLLISNAGWTEILDILIVAFLIYRGLLLLRGTQVPQILLGIALFALLGLLAQVLHLQILGWFFTNFAPMIIVSVVVLFQPELRRILDEVGKIGYTRITRSHVRRQVYSSAIEELEKGVIELSRRRIGALIVIERETGLEHYASTGVSINGEISSYMLLSIFSPGSPLHDGAVIIRGNQIRAAACVLPLSSESYTKERLGTRHRAALGLSMETDALVIVVSEETGFISIAFQGELFRDIDVDTLRDTLARRLPAAKESKFAVGVAKQVEHSN